MNMSPAKRKWKTLKIPPIVKFSKREYLEELQKGKMLMRNILYYQHYENKDKARSDIFDGAIPADDIIPNFIKNADEIPNKKIMPLNKYVFCFFRFMGNGLQWFKFTPENIKAVKEFKCENALIIDTDRFIEQLNQLLQNEYPTLNWGDVSYYKENDYIAAEKGLSYGSSPSCPMEFIKSERFKAQQEFRVSITYNSPQYEAFLCNSINNLTPEQSKLLRETPIAINIGSIESFSKIITTEDLIYNRF